MSLARSGLGDSMNRHRTTTENAWMVSIWDRLSWNSAEEEGRRRDLTNHDAPVEGCEITGWEMNDPTQSLTIFATKNATGTRAGTTRLRGQISDRGVSLFDLDSGILRGGRVARYLTSWRYSQLWGWFNKTGVVGDLWDIGEIYHDDSEWIIDLISLRDRTRRKTGSVASRLCQNELGVVRNTEGGTHLSRCTFDLSPSPFTLSGASINEFTDRYNIVAGVLSDPGVADGYYDRGRIKVLSGEMVDMIFPIYKHVARPGGLEHELQLALPLPRDLTVATDTIDIVTGCDHVASTCKTKFNNIGDMRADQLMPGQDIAIQAGTEAF